MQHIKNKVIKLKNKIFLTVHFILLAEGANMTFHH